jgi:ParB family chromosome partitioning protein
MPVLDIIRAMSVAGDPPKRSGSPKKSGLPQVLSSHSGTPLLRIDGKDRKGLKLTLFPQAGGSRKEAEAALWTLLDKHWQ